jgi:HlyD family secretion protein
MKTVDETNPKQPLGGQASADAMLTPDLDLSRLSRMGSIGLMVLIGVLVTWASVSVIGGAVVASGQTVVQGKPSLVQSLDGGEVAQIFVREGDLVHQGEVMVLLNSTLLEINLKSAHTRLASALALQARLKAEQHGTETIQFDYPSLPFERPTTVEHEKIQHEIFEVRAAVLEGQQEQLRESLLQFDGQNVGFTGQIDALQEQINLLEYDLGNMRQLANEGLVRQSQMSELQRSKSQSTGELARLEAERVRLSNARRDVTLQTLQETRTFQEGVVTDLREVSAEINELTLEIVTWQDQLSRVHVKAPTEGIIHQLQVTSPGRVIAPGGEIAQIVPVNGPIDFEVRVDPRSIDQVHLGQGAQLVLSSFDPQETPRIQARVGKVSPDVIVDPRNGQSYYNVNLELPPEAATLLSRLEIVPGMPVEAYLETGNRSVLSYLVHPITAQLRKAMRE